MGMAAAHTSGAIKVCAAGARTMGLLAFYPGRCTFQLRATRLRQGEQGVEVGITLTARLATFVQQPGKVCKENKEVLLAGASCMAGEVDRAL